MNVSRELIDRVERLLTFDPRSMRTALIERAPAADADLSAVQRRIAQALGEASTVGGGGGGGGAGAADLVVERILYGGDQLNVNFLERGMIAADAVARIEVYDDVSQVVGYGTGFMVSPRLLLTNHHVLPTPERAAVSWADFRHEFDALGRLFEPVTFALDPIAFFFTDADLDVTVVAVAAESPDGQSHVGSFGWLRLSPNNDTVLGGEWLSVIHHPAGRPKQVTLRQNLLISSDEDDLWYVTETAAGSSGAPLFNDSWQCVGVHRLGAPLRDRSGEILTLDGAPWTMRTDESDIVWRASIGTRTSAIVRRLGAACGDHALVRQLLRDGDADAAEAILIPLGSGRERAAEMAEKLDREQESEQLTAASGIEVPAAVGSGNGDGAHPPYEPPTPYETPTPYEPASNESVTVTVPLRITVRAGNGGGRAPVVGVKLS